MPAWLLLALQGPILAPRDNVLGGGGKLQSAERWTSSHLMRGDTVAKEGYR